MAGALPVSLATRASIACTATPFPSASMPTLSPSFSQCNRTPTCHPLNSLKDLKPLAGGLLAPGHLPKRNRASIRLGKPSRGSLLPSHLPTSAPDCSPEALHAPLSLLGGGGDGIPLLPSLGLLADVRSQGEMIASGQVGTVAACVALVLPTFAPLGMRIARRYMRPRKCYRCYGTGYHICEGCQGRGKEGGLVTALELKACRGCTGRGKTTCRPCRGTGLANYWLYSPNEKSTAWGPRGE